MAFEARKIVGLLIRLASGISGKKDGSILVLDEAPLHAGEVAAPGICATTEAGIDACGETVSMVWQDFRFLAIP